MTVSVLIISHEDIGAALIQTVTKTFEELPLPTTTVNVNSTTDPDELLPKLINLVQHIEGDDGILILTDLFGSTPSNIAKEIANIAKVRVVCGLNLPMLMRVMNYPNLTLDELAEKAISGGREGIIADEEQ